MCQPRVHEPAACVCAAGSLAKPDEVKRVCKSRRQRSTSSLKTFVTCFAAKDCNESLPCTAEVHVVIGANTVSMKVEVTMHREYIVQQNSCKASLKMSCHFSQCLCRNGVPMPGSRQQPLCFQNAMALSTRTPTGADSSKMQASNHGDRMKKWIMCLQILLKDARMALVTMRSMRADHCAVGPNLLHRSASELLPA